MAMGNVKGLLCCICYDLMLHPKVLNCGHSVCSSCTGGISKCPICRSSIFNTKTNYSLLDIINDIPITCHNQKCNWKGNIGELSIHTKKCDHELYKCFWCKQSITKIKLSDHLSYDCTFRKISCSQCKQNIRFMDKDHYKYDCPNRIIDCCDCHKKISHDQLNEHKQNHCMKRNVTCQYCSKIFKYELLLKHLDEKHRNYFCRKCYKKIPHNKSIYHSLTCKPPLVNKRFVH